MKIICIADMHSNIDGVTIPPCDILLIAGDAGPARIQPELSLGMQQAWFLGKFNRWLDKQPAKYEIIIPGNHDWIFQIDPDSVVPYLNCHYLMDSSITIEGLKIHGTPWQPVFNDWAFNAPEPLLAEKFEKIDSDIDILLSHCPPLNVLDFVPGPKGGEHCGSSSLMDKILQVKPIYVIFGHIHEAYGKVKKDGITFINCSVLDGQYRMTNKPVVVEFVKEIKR